MSDNSSGIKFRFLSPSTRSAYTGRCWYRFEHFQETNTVSLPHLDDNDSNLRIPLILRWCGCGRNWTGWYQERKNFPFLSLEIVTDGNAFYKENGEKFLVEPGHVILKKPRSNHILYPGPKGYIHKRYLALDGELVDMFLRTTGLYKYKVIKLKDSLRLIDKWKEIFLKCKQTSSNQYNVSGLCYDFLIELAEQSQTSVLPERITRILDFLHENHDKNLTLNDITKYANVSIPHLNTLFQKYIGKSPIDYHLSQKFEKVKQLLMDKNYSISEIAMRLGFESSSYFSASFRKKFGVSPRQYRNGNRATHHYSSSPREK